MKKKILLIISCVGALALASCKDFLKESPPTSLLVSQVFADATSAKIAVTGVYGTLATAQYYGKAIPWDLNMGSLFVCTGLDPTNSNQPAVNVSMFTHTAGTSTISGGYNTIYNTIAQCNNAIYQINHSDGITQTAKDSLTSDLHFLRGVAYLDVVRFWGAAPMPLVPAVGVEGTSLPRTPAQLMFNQIDSDFRFAFAYLPSKYGSGFWDQMRGRPLKWAAEVMLAKLFMLQATSNKWFFRKGEDFEPGTGKAYDDSYPYDTTMRYAFWDSAYVHLIDVYNANVYHLMPNYSDLFRFRNACTDESVYEVPFNGSQNGPSQWCTRTVTGGRGASGTNPYVPSVYTPIRLSNTNTTQIRASKMAFWWLAETYSTADMSQKYLLKKSNATPFNINNTDPRLLENFCTFRYPLIDGTTMNCYPYDGMTNTQNGCHPVWLKYSDPGIVGDNSGRCSWIVCRYADVLLMLAEASNALDHPVDETLGYVNQVLDRARNSLPYTDVANSRTLLTRSSAIDPSRTEPIQWTDTTNVLLTTKEGRLDAILRERAFELSFEGPHEYFDIRRYGEDHFKKMIELANHYETDTSYGVKYDSLSNPAGLTYAWNLRWDVPTQRWVRMGPMTDRRRIIPTDPSNVRKFMFFPFPSTELSYNTQMSAADQNYGF